MQTHWITNNNDRLILFFTGWGMDFYPTQHLSHEGYDLCVCYNYSDSIPAPISRWFQYKEIYLVAWSMGVWMAEKIFRDILFDFTRAVAINGTPTPVNDLTGIPVQIADSTYRTMDNDNLNRFYRRINQTPINIEQFEQNKPQRTIDDQRKELGLLVNQTGYYKPRIKWGKALISINDQIFSAENQKKYWTERPLTPIQIEYLNAPHNPFYKYGAWPEILHHQIR